MITHLNNSQPFHSVKSCLPLCMNSLQQCDYLQNLTLYWSHISAGIIPGILGTSQSPDTKMVKIPPVDKMNNVACLHIRPLNRMFSPENVTSSSSFINIQETDGSVFISVLHCEEHLMGIEF